MSDIINLTPHEITLMGRKIPPSGNIVRVEEKITIVHFMDWTVHEEDKMGNIITYKVKIPVIKKEFGKIDNLPEPKHDTIYIVSTIVAQVAMRTDVLSPGELVRDNKCNIVGAKSLAVIDQ